MHAKAKWETGRWWHTRKPEGWLHITKAEGGRFFWEAVLIGTDRTMDGYCDSLSEAKRAAHAAYDQAYARLVAARGGA
ncbi:MAG: hypothetical protein ING90_21295 [Rhodocyclaceae bacterium]|nr:hypothetical protein [Rhodocyclaceae bacterium]